MEDINKELKENTKSLNTLWGSLASVGANTAILFAIPSPTMRAFMGSGAFVGSLLGYGITVLCHKGQARWKRRIFAFLYSGLVVVSVLLGGFVMWALAPVNAQKYEWVETLREWLISPSLVADLCMLLAAGGGSCFLLAAFTVMSPTMARSVKKKNAD